MDNMQFYEAFRKVPISAKKEIKGGRLKGFTDINPMWRIKALTEMFGACGIGWWYEIKEKIFRASEQTDEVSVFVDVLLYYKHPETGEVSQGIPGTGGSSFISKEKSGHYMSDECFKMALTDALSVAAKALGVGADVYFEKDSNKYNAPPPIPTVHYSCEACGNPLDLYTGADGKTVPVKKHAEGSEAKFGRVLCLDCIKELTNGNS